MNMEQLVESELAGEREVPFCLPQIPHDLMLDRTCATRVESQQLTSWVMAQPPASIKTEDFFNNY
jgi:hypothetical protein